MTNFEYIQGLSLKDRVTVVSPKCYFCTHFDNDTVCENPVFSECVKSNVEWLNQERKTLGGNE